MLDPLSQQLKNYFDCLRQNSADIFIAMLMFSADIFVVAATLQRQKKRKTNAETSAPVPEPSEFRCLVRATDGKKKISCSVRCLVLNIRSSSSLLCVFDFVLFNSFSVCCKDLRVQKQFRRGRRLCIQGLTDIGFVIAAHGQGSSQIPNVICNCFEGSHGFFEKEGKERQKGEKDHSCESSGFLNSQ